MRTGMGSFSPNKVVKLKTIKKLMFGMRKNIVKFLTKWIKMNVKRCCLIAFDEFHPKLVSNQCVNQVFIQRKTTLIADIVFHK